MAIDIDYLNNLLANLGNETLPYRWANGDVLGGVDGSLVIASWNTPDFDNTPSANLILEAVNALPELLSEISRLRAVLYSVDAAFQVVKVNGCLLEDELVEASERVRAVMDADDSNDQCWHRWFWKI